MPSTYTTNLGIELPADGELDGVWGDVINDNMSILDRGINGSLALSLSGTSSTLTTSNGALSDGQYKLLVLGGTPSGTHTITIAPSTAQKIYFVRNTTAQSVVFTQGSGGNVTVATGDSAIIYSDGAGAGAAVINITNDFAMSSVKITGGTIDGAIVGGTTPAAGTFTTANATTVDTTNIEVTTLKAKDGTSAGSIADSTGVVTLASSVLTTTDINGGTIDGAIVGGTTPAAGTFTTANATTVDTTNIEVTTLKAKDGTSAGSIADSTGVVTLASSVLTTTDINGGTIDGAIVGGTTPAAGTFTTANATNIEVTTLKAKDGTSAGSIADSTGVVTLASSVLTTTDINGGTIDGTVIGGTSAAAGTFTTANATTVDTTNIEVTTLKAKDGTSAGSIADSTGVVTLASSVLTTTDINGGTIDGTAIGGSSAAAGTFTTVDASGVASFADGTAALPSITNTGDTNTGVFFPAADTVAVSTAGTERVRIDSSGNVGIGTSSPAAKLEVSGDIISVASGTSSVAARSGDNTNYSQLRFRQTATESRVESFAAGTGTFVPLTFHVNSAERMRIDSTGNVGIGTSSPTYALSVGANSNGFYSDANGFYLVQGASTGDVLSLQSSGFVDYRSDDANATVNTGHRFYTDNTERMRINASGNVGIGTTSPSYELEVAGTGDIITASSVTTAGFLATTTTANIAYCALINSARSWNIRNNAAGSFVIRDQTAALDRVTIDTSGNVTIATSSTPNTLVSTTTIVGIGFSEAGYGVFVRDSSTTLYVNRLTNDGALVEFRQAGVSEGTISVSGTTVSYNGGHLSRWAQFPDNSRPELLKGTVMSNLDQMSNWADEENEQLNCVEISTVEGDANVAGLFVAWDSTEDDYNDILLAMTGDMVIRIAAGVTVARGDLLMSAGDGTAKPQADDIIRAKTIAKVTSNHVSHTYADGSYAVPCVVMAC